MIDAWNDAFALADAVRAGRSSAASVTKAALDRIEAESDRLNCFTEVLADSARTTASRLDQEIAAGRDPGPLAGVPFAVKNLFDIQGIPTLAGSRIGLEAAPAVRNAAAVDRLCRSGAVLVGTLNMDEYAYGFTTENTHYGATRNPYDLSRVAGGSSGGSAAAVAAGLVPITLGTDTNGSVRVPASLCGLVGFKPTFGRISRAGVDLFAPSLDHVGILSRTVRDAALAYDLLHGPDPTDPSCGGEPAEASLTCLDDAGEVRIALARGYFAEDAVPEALEAARQVAGALGAQSDVTIREAAVARAAAALTTAVEGSTLHLDDLRRRPMDFDPMTRDRFLAGALIPGTVYLCAQSFRRRYQTWMRALFEDIDVFVTPTTPIPAPEIGQERIDIGGKTLMVRPHLGKYTQPISFIGLPSISVPVRHSGPLPLGVQLVAAPYREVTLLRVARRLEREGIIGFTRPAGRTP